MMKLNKIKSVDNVFLKLHKKQNRIRQHVRQVKIISLHFYVIIYLCIILKEFKIPVM